MSSGLIRNRSMWRAQLVEPLSPAPPERLDPHVALAALDAAHVIVVEAGAVARTAGSDCASRALPRSRPRQSGGLVLAPLIT